ncbi:acyl-protein synthetase [Neptunicella sp. SCSIO 80796]|uniref:LuxE/PaaK family acyltransferase n=1 Tax=Neptunicella plasticusilytica TaxID=3117012 RepID=UPI003A4D5256
MNTESYLDAPVYSWKSDDKQDFLQRELIALTQYHIEHCQPYRQLIQQGKYTGNLTSTATIPPISVKLFKELELKSIMKSEVFKQLNSSGTTGTPSKIYLSAVNAKLQSQILVKLMQSWLGKSRRPMLLIDSPTTIKKAGEMTARAAGLQGFSIFGRNHTYALDENMQLDLQAVSEFFEQYSHQPVLIFGFTFMVWQRFIQALQKTCTEFECDDAILIHGGGWKKLQNHAISSENFKLTIRAQLGNVAVHDYYGMVEQTGTIYMECEQGHLHCPVWSDILIRNPADMSLCRHHQIGLIQVNSVLAQSYPGHCLLTEDLGEILGEDNCPCGRNGKYFRVHGRVPQAEVRGCSDTFA